MAVRNVTQGLKLSKPEARPGEVSEAPWIEIVTLRQSSWSQPLGAQDPAALPDTLVHECVGADCPAEQVCRQEANVLQGASVLV